MPEIANSALHHPRSIALSEEQIFRLWCAAIKDDDKQLDDVIQRVYRDLIKHDRERFEEVMYLTITRDVSAERALTELLNDIPASSADPLPAQLH
jgi:hemerythrin superfamily protein